MRGPSEPLKEALGTLFRNRRQALGFSLAQLVEQVRDLGGNVDESTVSRIEAGKVLPGVETVFFLSRALGIPFSRVEEELALAAEAPASLVEPGATAESLLERGRQHMARGRCPLAVHVFRVALDRALRDAAPAETIGDIRTWLGDALRSAGNPRAADEVLREVVNDTSLSPDVLLRALMTRVQVQGWLRDRVAAEGLASRVGRWYEQAGARARAYADTVLAFLAFRQRRWEEAARLYEKAEAAWLDVGIPLEAFRSRASRASCLVDLGRPAEALPLVEDALEQAREQEALEVAAWCLRVRARARDALGEPDERVLRDLEEARKIARDVGLAWDEFMAWHGMWTWLRRHGGPPGEIARAVRGMRRLLGEVDPSVEEVGEFLEVLAREEAPSDEEGRSR